VARSLTALAVAVAATFVVGCGSSGSPAASSTSPAAGTPTPSRVGGLVGVIDAARVAAVCTDVRQAQTILDSGMGAGGMDATVTASLRAAADLLERPPVDPSAAAAGASIRAAVRDGHEEVAVRAGLAFCRTHAG
jgi:hypothetical protein